MKTNKNILDEYCNYLENMYCDEVIDELLSKKYVIGKEFGSGVFSRIKLEEGLEISKFKIDNMVIDFDNSIYDDDIVEVGYCYSGSIKIIILPDNEEIK